MKVYRAFCVALLLAASAQSHAQTIIGVGTASCGTFNEQIKGTPAEFYYESWAVGFLSSMNYVYYKYDILKNTDAAAISGAYKKHCADHPLDQFALAVLSVAAQLKNRESPPETNSKKK